MKAKVVHEKVVGEWVAEVRETKRDYLTGEEVTFEVFERFSDSAGFNYVSKHETLEQAIKAVNNLT